MTDIATSPFTPVTNKFYVKNLVAIVVLLNLLVYALAGVSLYHSWNKDRTRVATATQNLALVLENSIAGMLGKVDVALLGVVVEAEEQLARGKIDRKTFELHMARQSSVIAELDSVRMADADGSVLYGKGSAITPPVNISDREYFRNVRDNPRAETYISRPFFGRLTKAWVCAVARRVNHPDGSFAGVAYGIIPIELFTRLFSALDVGRDGSITLRDTNLAVVARFPEPAGVGSSIGQISTMKEFVDITRTGNPTGTFSGTSGLDQIKRVFSYRKIPNHPFYIVVGQDTSTALADWRREAMVLTGMVTFFSIVTVLFSLQLYHKWQQEQQIEAELRTSNQLLEVRVVDRTAELSMINHQLQMELAERKRAEVELNKRTAEVEQFLYTASHDLRSPLVTVKTFLGYLGQDISSADNERIAKDMGFLNSAANRMEALLNELLEMSRIERVNLPHEEFGLRELVADALDATAGQITAGRVDVRVGECDLTLNGDRRRLLQIWQNLLDNAVKYMGNQTEPLIEIGCEHMQGETVFFVRDNGVGVAPEYHDKVFGIFEQLDRTFGGVGMGLTMVKRIVEMYGGKIRVESDGVGRGSCFRFTLPGAVKTADGKEGLT
jgi:signal transduction histidine kinase